MAAKIFGVIKNNGQFCEIHYSWYIKHHHTLKRQYARFRVVEQMKCVVTDHVESGYLSKVEYRAVKEPDGEVDYIIRYYPGPGANESTGRIQTYIRQRKGRTKLLSTTGTKKEGTEVFAEQPQVLALSVITAQHHSLIRRLAFEFGIGLSKAYDLTVTRKETVILQLDAWPFRSVKPRNVAGWMIQAVEKDYEVPNSYFEDRKKHLESQQLQAAQAARQACTICDGTGFRRVSSVQYPSGAMRQCTHDPRIESGYDAAGGNPSLPSPTETSPNAQNGPTSASLDQDGENRTKRENSPR